MRTPVTISNRSSTMSRSRNAYQNIEIAPISSAEVPSHTRWEWMRFSSERHIRIQVAFSGVSRPSSFSIAITKTSSFAWNER